MKNKIKTKNIIKLTLFFLVFLTNKINFALLNKVNIHIPENIFNIIYIILCILLALWAFKDYLNKSFLKKAIIAFLIFWYGRYIQYIPILLFNINPENTNIQVLLSTFSNIFECILLILLFKDDLKKEFIKYKNNLAYSIDCGLKYWLLGTLVMIVSNIIIVFIFKGNGATNQKMVQKMIDSTPYIMLLNSGIFGPITEELVFRKAFKSLITNKWLFVITSSLIFGGLHVIMIAQSIPELLYIIPYSSLGAAFAIMYIKTDNIYTSLSMHMLHNTLFTLLSI